LDWKAPVQKERCQSKEGMCTILFCAHNIARH
jgi:hypothetical protein